MDFNIENITLHVIEKNELDKLILFQKSIIDKMKYKEWFVPLTEKEFLTSIKGRDNAYFFTYNNEIIGLLVLSCDIPDVLEEYRLPKGDYMLIDSVMVKDEYRGYGLQRKMLQFANDRAKKLNMNGLVATIHPDNLYSLNNFYSEDYVLLHKLKIHGGPRDVVIKYIN